jgi:hypothetical protein
MLQSCVYTSFKFFNGTIEHGKQLIESNICRSWNKPSHKWVGALLRLHGIQEMDRAVCQYRVVQWVETGVYGHKGKYFVLKNIATFVAIWRKVVEFKE